MQVEPITTSIGAEISGISLAGMSDTTFASLQEALWTHQVLVVRDQKMTPEEHLDLGRRFGELHTHPAFADKGDYPEILQINNTGKDKTITEVWHSDVSCDQRPPSISILRALEVPVAGGDTMWASQYAALDLLSPGMVQMLEPLRAVHKNFDLESVHPVIRTHPETGRRALYVNKGFTSHFENMTVAESRPLLDYLVNVGSQPDLTMRHRWQANDVVFWDNRCVMHFAIHDYGDAPRAMRRVTVRGERPV